MNILTRQFILCLGLFTAGSSIAATRTWTGAAGTTVINTPGNWSGNAAPTSAGGDRAVWDGTVQTNVPYSWTAGFGSGNAGGMGLEIGPAHTAPFTIYGFGAAAGNGAGMSNFVISAGAGPFTLGDTNGVVFSTVNWRSAGTNGFLNYSSFPGTIAQNVLFNNGSGAGRSVYLIGSWNIYSPLQPDGSGGMALIVDGTSADVVTLNAPYTKNSQNWTLNNGTLMPTVGDALGMNGTLTLTIGGGAGIKRLALTNSVWLNPALANINIAGREDVVGAANAAIYNASGDNYINGVVRFNTFGGTNVGIYNQSGSLTLNGNATLLALTAANVTGARYFAFDGPGTTTVQGTIANGSATLGLRQLGGNLALNNANTHTGNTLLEGGILNMGNDLALQNSTVVVTGGKLNLNGAMITAPVLGGLAGTGMVTTDSGGTLALSVGNNNASTTFSGSLNNSAGTISLQKVGTGTLTLGGSSTYSGGTVIANGVLLISNTTGSGTGSGSVTVNSGTAFGGTGIAQGSVDWASGSSARFVLTPTTAVAGSNATPLTVSGSVTLNGNSVVVDVPGSAPIGVGTYRLMTYNNSGSSGVFSSSPVYAGAGVELGTASTITTGGGVVTLQVQLTGVASTWTNDNNGNWSTGANWSSNPYYPQVAGDAAKLGVGTSFRTVTLDTDVSVGTLVFTNENSFMISGAAKTLTLANTVGPAVISVQAGSSNSVVAPVALGSDVTVQTTSGTSLVFSNSLNNASGTRTVNVSGAGTVVLNANNAYGPAAGSVGTTLSGGVLQLGTGSSIGLGDLSVSSGTLRAGAALTLANNIIAAAGVTTVDNNTNDVTLSGVISGAGGLTKQNPGTLTLSSANTYNGNTTVNAGTLRLTVPGAIPSGAGNGNVSVNTNALVDVNGTSQTFNGLNGAGNVDSLSGGSITLTVGENNANGTLTGAIRNTAGTLALVKNGTGTQALAGTNSYTGGTTINAGTLQIGNGGVSGNLGSGPLVNNGNLAFNLTGTNVFTGSISGSGTVTLANTNLHLWLTGNNTFTGNVQNNGGVLWITNAASLGTGPKTVIAVGALNSQFTQIRLAGNITIDPSISFSLSYNAGVLVNVSGNNTIQGPIAMPNGGGNPLVIVNSGFLTLAGDITTVADNNARTLTLDGAADGLVSGNISDAGPQASVTKNGSGTWTLSGAANAYTGATTVNAGTLLVNGNNFGAGAVTVVSNASFGGVGVVSSAVTWQPTSKAVFTVNPSGGANTTPFTVNAAVTANNNSVVVNIPGVTPLPAGTYVLMNATSIAGAFASTPVLNGAGVVPNTFATVVTANGVVTLVVVPNSVWVNNGNGAWSTSANWNTNPDFPDAAGEFATFGVGSSLTTVDLDANRTVGGINFTNPNSFVISSAANTLTLNNSGNGATISVNGGAANVISARIEAADNTIISVGASNSLSLPQAVSGFGSLTKSGDGVLVLAGSNSFSGAMTLSGGTLALGSTNAFGTGALTIGGGSLDSLSPNLVNRNNNPQTWAGSFAFLGSQNLDLGNGSVTLAANLTLGLSNSTLAVRGPIDGAFTLTVQGTTNAVLALDGNNSFTGFTSLGGTLVLGSDTALGATTSTLQFTPGNAAGITLRTKDAAKRTIQNNVSVNSDVGPYVLSGAGEFEFTGTIVSGNGQKRFFVETPTTFSGLVTDNGAPFGPVVKDGPARLIVSGANTLTKSFRIDAGTLALGNSSALGTGTLLINGGGLDSLIPDMVNVGNNAQTWNGSFWFVGTENLSFGTGPVLLNTNVTVTVSNKVLTLDGSVSGSFALTKAGAGRLVLNGANNVGNVSVTGGTLEITQATLRTNSTVSVSSGSVLQLNFGTTNQVAALVLNGVFQPAGVYKAGNTGGLISGSGSLLVVPIGPSGPGQLMSVINGNQLNLSWPAGQGWRLQMQTNSLSTGLSTNWVYVTDGSVSSTNVTVDATKPTTFFRLVYP